jgi:hypothetical protein
MGNCSDLIADGHSTSVLVHLQTPVAGTLLALSPVANLPRCSQRVWHNPPPACALALRAGNSYPIFKQANER